MPYLRHSLKSALLLLFICYSNGLFAQYNFYKFTAGAGYGATLTFPDTKTVVDFATYGSLDYNLTPYLTLGGELQKGKLIGGDDHYGSKNNYTTVTLNGKIHLGEFMSKKDFDNFFFNSIRGLYVGAGIGIIKNKVDVVKSGSSEVKSTEVIFPFNAGINFYFRNHWGYSRFIFNFNVQGTTSLEDGIDGDLNQYSNFNDFYNFFSVGLKYNFGPLGLYRKR